MQLIIFMGIQASGKSSYYLLNLAHSHLRINLDMLKTPIFKCFKIGFCLSYHSQLAEESSLKRFSIFKIE